jgi:hypothetical protein
MLTHKLALFSDALREEIFRHYLESEQFVTGLVNSERRKGEISLAFEREVLRLVVQINPATQQLFTDQEARGIVGQRMVAEIAEMAHSVSFLQNGIPRAAAFRQRADALMRKLTPRSWWDRMYRPP